MAELVVGENSYISLDEANSLVENNYISFSDEYKFWSSLSDNDKAVMVLNATNLITDDTFLWKGVRADSEQNLVFPRKLENDDIIEFSDKMKIGLIELVMRMNATNFNKFGQLIKNGISSFSDGAGMSVKFVDNIVNKISGKNSVDRIPVDIFNKYFIEYTWLVFYGG